MKSFFWLDCFIKLDLYKMIDWNFLIQLKYSGEDKMDQKMQSKKAEPKKAEQMAKHIFIVVHALLPSFRATIFFTLQAQSRFKQAAVFSFLFPYQ